MAVMRSALGVLLLLAYVAVSDARWIYRAGRVLLDAGEEDPITRDERRYEELKRALPSHGVIGYISGAERFGTGEFKRFLLTEYALAPLVLINDTAPDLIVGNFHPDSVPAAPPVPGLRLVKDFGDGVWLLQKASR
jgi:hypothetical protein